ncbi:Gfo/Idh/MocA family oxidoreductase [Microbacterium sp. EYE_5]|uniref:Gfo/Idh/MocA family protein n=1 Tax=unclassified Microbacterium TaxID=2609290 RepID=UPI00200660C7|nr:MULTISPECIES: Gfo/Idh/MocA family oxidoreductase [unclassified Microbacterium]MCK6080189.1 Gfo/Idh/MocA family oxidoreductase [Microbacterium sp. EYE_382]MCK6085460.1 Gfo/Idh/MocA family oxidoreductase [Microbacterium sp. EYE_384]MCK6122315.1 Gfo/Idh/MocA family oxidoreductase [Microbacterium sp. EYE_80]MCK6126223.1 Gfo/Idh/MocA family oxidoreductase [Microbacterium sp. EYE_79]MCK6141144.1 Gfo/Idh/MocA family oxidoreductase [Microbacterium sp. EYE_39]
MTAPVGVGIVGAGVISQTYLENLTSFPDVKVVAIGDLIPERAQAKAEEHGVASWGTLDDVLANPEVELVVNLTIPESHIEVSARAVAAGKHVWTEKPLGLDREGARQLLRDAEAAGVRVGSAPDTILGPGFQSAKRAIAEGVIGTPLFVQTAFQTQGPDLWHPEPAFLFARGAGPLLDMGPYYFSALVSLLGPIAGVAARGSRFRTERHIHTGPRAGETFPVEVPSSVQVVSTFEGGQHGTHLLSFDSALERHGVVEIHGTEGSIVLPDPNRFDGPTRYVKPLGVFRDGMKTEQEWIDVEQQGTVVGRGLGVLDMVRAVAEDRPHVATGELGFHVLDVLLSAQDSAETGQYIEIDSTVTPVPAVPVDFDPFARTL